MGHHQKERDSILPPAESLIKENVAWPIVKEESTNIEQTPRPIVKEESSNILQAPWHNDILETPPTYETRDLFEWKPPPLVVSRNPKGYGEMGKIWFSIKSQNENRSF